MTVRIPIDKGKLEGLLRYGASAWEVAAEFDCSEDTISNFIREHYGCTFSELRSKEFSKVQLRLKQAQIRMALGGLQKKTVFDKIRRRLPDGSNITEIVAKTVEVEEPPNESMLMWLGRQLLGQNDEAKHAQDLEALRSRFEKPVIQIEVQNADGTTIQQLERKWCDQAQLAAEMENASKPPPPPEDEALDADEIEADTLD